MGKKEEEIWALEEAYFTNLYKADYDALLAIVHSKFLAWPDSLPQPIDRQGSARFMKQLVPVPVSCTINIEREGIQVLEETALTQYTLQVTRNDQGPGAATRSSRITHAWVREGGRWKVLGGMSCDR